MPNDVRSTWFNEPDPLGEDRSTWSNEPGQSEDAVAPPVGDEDRYVLGALIGQGGAAEVRTALDTRLDREVAIKQLSDRDPRSRARFVGEARVTARLEHPNIVPIHDLGVTEDGQPYLAMKRVRGRSLRALLVEAPPESVAARLAIFQKLCDAVAFAHARGVLHRDLKPENVMVGEFGEVLLMDWGCAVAADPATGVELAPTGGVVGTPEFMAPEQSLAAPATTRLDIYGLGVVLYELVTGKAAFARGDDVLERVQRGGYPAPRRVAPALSAELERVIQRAMATRPEDRYPSVVALREDIDAILSHHPLVHVRSTPLERLHKWMDRHRGTIRAASAATALGLVVLLIASLRYDRQIGVARDEAVEAAARARAAERESVGREVRAQVALADTLAAQGQVLEAETHLRAAEALVTGRDLDRRVLDLAWSQHVADNPPPVATCSPHGGAVVRALALTADGRDAWSWGGDGRLVRWDPVGCAERSSAILGGSPGPGALDAARGVGAFIVGSDLIRVDLANGAELRVAAPAGATDVGLDQGALWVRDGDFDIWQLNPEQTALVRLEADAVKGTRWRPEAGGRVWVADSTRTGHEVGGVWRASDGASRFARRGLDTADLSADGAVLLVGDSAGIELVDVGTGLRWRRDQEPAGVVGLSPDDTVGWVQLFDGSIRVFDLERGEPLAEYVGPGDLPTAVTATPRARLLAIAGREGRVMVYLRPPFPARVPPQPLDTITQGLAISPDGRRMAIGDEDGGIALVDLMTGRTVRAWSGWTSGVRQLAFSPDGRRLAAAVRNDGVALLDAESGETRTIPLAVRTVSVAWTGAGVTTVDIDGLVQRIDPDSGVVTAEGQGQRAGSWALTARGDQLLTAGHVGDTHDVLLLSAADGSVVRRFPFPEIGFHVAWSPDGAQIAVASSSGKVTIVQLSDGAVLRTLSADAGPTIGVDWSSDGRLIATTGYSRQVKIWDARTGELLRAVPQHEGPGVNVRFSLDGSRLYSSGSDGYRVLPLRAHQQHDADVALLREGGPGRAAALARLGWWERVEEFAGESDEDRWLVSEARSVLADPAK